MEFITTNAKETSQQGQIFGSQLKGGEVVALYGMMGAGKTTFIQGLAKSLGIKSRVLSPTFILMRTYEIKKNSNIKNFFHVDLYRLEGNFSEEIQNLGLSSLWGRRDNIVVIEWAEKIKNLLPKNTIFVKLDYKDNNTRSINYEI